MRLSQYRQPVTLWHLMENCRVSDLALMLMALSAASSDLLKADQFPDAPVIDDDFYTSLASALKGLGSCCQCLDADSVLIGQISRLIGSVKESSDMRPAILRGQLEMILTSVREILNRTSFMYLSEVDVHFWDNPHLLGTHFAKQFPDEAQVDMREAGKCFAAQIHTACVFHGMRVAEHGLRVLARLMKISISDNGKKCPIEYGTWNKVITQIKNKISKSRTLSPGPKKRDALAFQSSMADHCEYMRDIWRNEVSHTGRAYNRQEAHAALNRVSDFVNALSLHIEGPQPARHGSGVRRNTLP